MFAAPASDFRCRLAGDSGYASGGRHFSGHLGQSDRRTRQLRDGGAPPVLGAGCGKACGDLLSLLDELGIAGKTLVVFTSDNGGVSHAYRSLSPPHTHNAPLSSGKGSHREGAIRVPLLVRWPGVTKGRSVCDVPVMIYDWFPTLLNVAGASAPAEIDGHDLAPLCAAAEAPTPFLQTPIL